MCIATIAYGLWFKSIVNLTIFFFTKEMQDTLSVLCDTDNSIDAQDVLHTDIFNLKQLKEKIT